MATQGTRGKWAEGQVRAWLQKRSDADARLAYARWPDARAGSLQVAPADFVISHARQHFKLEVKEVQIKTETSRRLPKGNFSADKVARMQKWRMAGDECWVAVCHIGPAPEGKSKLVREWRLAPIEYFQPGVASWDMLFWKVYPSLDSLMLSLFPEKK